MFSPCLETGFGPLVQKLTDFRPVAFTNHKDVSTSKETRPVPGRPTGPRRSAGDLHPQSSGGLIGARVLAAAAPAAAGRSSAWFGGGVGGGVWARV